MSTRTIKEKQDLIMHMASTIIAGQGKISYDKHDVFLAVSSAGKIYRETLERVVCDSELEEIKEKQ